MGVGSSIDDNDDDGEGGKRKRKRKRKKELKAHSQRNQKITENRKKS